MEVSLVNHARFEENADHVSSAILLTQGLHLVFFDRFFFYHQGMVGYYDMETTPGVYKVNNSRKKICEHIMQYS